MQVPFAGMRDVRMRQKREQKAFVGKFVLAVLALTIGGFSLLSGFWLLVGAPATSLG